MAGFAGADLIASVVHLCHDLEPVEDVQSLGAFFADALQIAGSQSFVVLLFRRSLLCDDIGNLC